MAQLTQFFTYLLTQTASFLGGNYGYAIIAVTLAIRFVLLPIVIPSIKSQRKMVDLKPELDKLKKKYSHDKELFAKKQMELYQEHKINPLGGCLPQLAQVALFIIFYRVLINALNGDVSLLGSTQFFWLDITQPDKTFILPVLAGASQFLLGIMLMPATDTHAEAELASKTESNKDDKEAVDMDSMAKTMQSQMIFVMPVITVFIALRFPSGLALYWVTSTIFSLVQQYFVSGLGGLKPYLVKFGITK